jgi:hypothetical protein
MISEDPSTTEILDSPAWFGGRELSWLPDHFVSFLCSEKIYAERKVWIHNNTRGRFAFGLKCTAFSTGIQVIIRKHYVGFEDPADATLYMLKFTT